MAKPDPRPYHRWMAIPRCVGRSGRREAARLGATVVLPAAFPRTRRRLEALGLAVRTVPADELAKAEGGVTCCSILVDSPAGPGRRI